MVSNADDSWSFFKYFVMNCHFQTLFRQCCCIWFLPNFSLFSVHFSLDSGTGPVFIRLRAMVTVFMCGWKKGKLGAGSHLLTPWAFWACKTDRGWMGLSIISESDPMTLPQFSYVLVSECQCRWKFWYVLVVCWFVLFGMYWLICLDFQLRSSCWRAWHASTEAMSICSSMSLAVLRKMRWVVKRKAITYLENFWVVNERYFLQSLTESLEQWLYTWYL